MRNRYPNSPGSRRGSPETAFEAAKSIVEIAMSIRARVLDVVTAAGERGLTGDEVAATLDLTVYQVRSRLAELRAAKLISDSKRRGKLASGRNGAIWVLRQFAPREPDDGQGDLLAA